MHEVTRACAQESESKAGVVVVFLKKNRADREKTVTTGKTECGR
jgi:hypothetical protein